MKLKDIKLEKGMSKEEVNNLTKDYILLEDEIYMGNNHKHDWKCKCGNIIEGRRWSGIRQRGMYKCKRCKYYEVEHRYKTYVEKDGDYEYIRSFRMGDFLPNGMIVGDTPYMQVVHKYCGNVYEVQVSGFMNRNYRCTKCCKTYENSFAYHIEVELGEPLEKYWDFEKNTVNPYHISKGKNVKGKDGENDKVWIKCQEKDYHGSYEIGCVYFLKGVRCGYCTNHHGKVHPYDSFGAKNPDKVKCWHEDNDKSPYEVAPNARKKYKFRCDTCHHVWEMSLYARSWCPKCNASEGEKRVKGWLDSNGFSYIHDEEYFKDLLGVNNGVLRPDFILPNEKIWIEYDGEFHYKKMYDDDGYETLKEHDKRKDEYAKKHNWKMIRIPYWDFDNIEEILKEICLIGGVPQNV